MPDGPFRQAEARRSVKMLLVPRDSGEPTFDSMVPDHLVTDPMANRHLALRPPQFRVRAEFDPIIDEIERAFELGYWFSAIAASVVTIERMLNDARMRLHAHSTPKLKGLWEKGPLNDWSENIAALVKWGYLEQELGAELSIVYEIRCRYLHSGPIDTIEADAARCVHTAFKVLTEFIGFPERLFQISSAIECRDSSHPLFEVFYKPELSSKGNPD
jgi:hypothetical protein